MNPRSPAAAPEWIAPKTIIDLIKIQAARIPDRIALQMANESGVGRVYLCGDVYPVAPSRVAAMGKRFAKRRPRGIGF